ncbi:MAG TPA: hypothetical protein DCG48_04410 [Rhodospirillaceae bacterium]|nr:hypothetical protein [Rhodospirillaceae bacterium]|tara:strand:- start:15320 stop:15655 length:336 start_codon:yes stop_codon:yes gene_type:complete
MADEASEDKMPVWDQVKVWLVIIVVVVVIISGVLKLLEPKKQTVDGCLNDRIAKAASNCVAAYSKDTDNKLENCLKRVDLAQRGTKADCERFIRQLERDRPDSWFKRTFSN